MPMLDPELKEKINSFIFDLKNSKIEGSYQIASETLQILRRIISEAEWNTAMDLMDLVKREGYLMSEADPCETCVGNIVRRILKMIREEYDRSFKGADQVPTVSQSAMLNTEGKVEEYNKSAPHLKDMVLEATEELRTEMEGSVEDIASRALEHIHANEIIFTAGKSRTVEAFLKKAAKKRKFQVIVMECAPAFHGHEMAKRLATSGIETTVVPDSAVFAIMARVNKVIIGTHTVLADGGLKAINGAYNVATAAKHYSVPVIVVTPTYKLSNTLFHDQDNFNKFVQPAGELDFSGDDVLSSVPVYNPVFDYVPANHVSLFITNDGGLAPDYIYQSQRELYHKDDESLEPKT